VWARSCGKTPRGCRAGFASPCRACRDIPGPESPDRVAKRCGNRRSSVLEIVGEHLAWGPAMPSPAFGELSQSEPAPDGLSIEIQSSLVSLCEAPAWNKANYLQVPLQPKLPALHGRRWRRRRDWHTGSTSPQDAGRWSDPASSAGGNVKSRLCSSRNRSMATDKFSTRWKRSAICCAWRAPRAAPSAYRPQRSHTIVATSGCCWSHSAKLSADRSGSTSATRCRSRLTRIAP
jgi:hypothetical protein